MATVSEGMNVGEVRQLAKDLTGVAQQIDTIIAELARRIPATTWVGKDSRDFKGPWWEGHRKSLRKVVDDLNGYSRSASNNADEQERASGGGGTSNGGGGGGGTPTPSPGAPPTLPQAPGGAGADPGSAGWGGAGNEFLADWKNRGNGYDQWNFTYGPSNGMQGDCTSFVAWRLNKLAAANGHENWFSNNHLGGTSGLRFGGGGQSWIDQAQKLGIAPSGTPHAGDVAIWNGHVAIVKAVGADGAVSFEESSWGYSGDADGYTYKEFTGSAANGYGHKLGFLGFVSLLPK